MRFLTSLSGLFYLCYSVRGYLYSCNEIIFNDYGQFSVQETLQACSDSMRDPLLPISYDPHFEDLLNVSCQISLSNLVALDEVESTVSLDFFMRQSWNDPRWIMNASFWQHLHPKVKFAGLEIHHIASADPGDDKTTIWLPDIEIEDTIDIEEYASTLKLYPDGTLYRSQHFTVILKQSHFDLRKYPLDEQSIRLKLMSFGLELPFLYMKWADPPITYLTNAQEEIVFEENAIWKHKSGDYKAIVYIDEEIMHDQASYYDILEVGRQLCY